jgi:hypothetical protein
MLGDFENETLAVVFRFQRVQDLRQMIVEGHVDDGADDLRDASPGDSRSGRRRSLGLGCGALARRLGGCRCLRRVCRGGRCLSHVVHNLFYSLRAPRRPK